MFFLPLFGYYNFEVSFMYTQWIELGLPKLNRCATCENCELLKLNAHLHTHGGLLHIIRFWHRGRVSQSGRIDLWLNAIVAAALVYVHTNRVAMCTRITSGAHIRCNHIFYNVFISLLHNRAAHGRHRSNMSLYAHKILSIYVRIDERIKYMCALVVFGPSTEFEGSVIKTHVLRYRQMQYILYAWLLLWIWYFCVRNFVCKFVHENIGRIGVFRNFLFECESQLWCCFACKTMNT